MRKLTAIIAASCFLFLAAPTANADEAGPGYAVCKAATNAYELATGREAPWYCLY